MWPLYILGYRNINVLDNGILPQNLLEYLITCDMCIALHSIANMYVYIYIYNRIYIEFLNLGDLMISNDKNLCLFVTES